ncbi:unnamed protein product [Schistosoma mattheei]|uniref:Enkurin domain-containing protein n=1 Tax=Schistosoma mattheei TaxID=31246 RepID=A0AA85B435_9TREM|nr:unnamed protein product [Schistosoma mattheei]
MRESIYNLIPLEQPPKALLPRYKSCSQREVISLFNIKKFPCKTMGVPKVNPPNPQCYLKMRHSAPELFRKNDEPLKGEKCSDGYHKDEKKSLIDQLKDKWQQRYRQYQSLSVMIDTPPKMHHKLWLEKEMEDIEKT